MTFDDGILKIYDAENTAEKGMKPVIKLVLKSSHYFGFETIGFSRYYTALQAQSRISNLVRIWQDRDITPEQICVLEDGKRYKITLIQHVKSDDGLDVSRLTLERINEDYEYAENISS